MSDLTFNLLLLAAGLSFSGLFIAVIVINPYGPSNNAMVRGLGWTLTVGGVVFLASMLISLAVDVVGN